MSATAQTHATAPPAERLHVLNSISMANAHIFNAALKAASPRALETRQVRYTPPTSCCCPARSSLALWGGHLSLRQWTESLSRRTCKAATNPAVAPGVWRARLKPAFPACGAARALHPPLSLIQCVRSGCHGCKSVAYGLVWQSRQGLSILQPAAEASGGSTPDCLKQPEWSSVEVHTGPAVMLCLTSFALT